MPSSDFVIWDPPFGFNMAPWDETPFSPEQVQTAFNQMRAVQKSKDGNWVLCIYVPIAQYGMYEEVMRANHATSVECVYWVKPNHNKLGTNNFINAMQPVMVVVFGEVPQKNNMSDNPLERANLRTAPSPRTLTKLAGTSTPVNVTEKPPCIAEMLALVYCHTDRGKYTLVPCSGAGGDVVGLLVAGRNVIAIDKDPIQCEALVARLQLLDTQHQAMVKAAGGRAPPAYLWRERKASENAELKALPFHDPARDPPPKKKRKRKPAAIEHKEEEQPAGEGGKEEMCVVCGSKEVHESTLQECRMCRCLCTRNASTCPSPRWAAWAPARSSASGCFCTSPLMASRRRTWPSSSRSTRRSSWNSLIWRRLPCDWWLLWLVFFCLFLTSSMIDLVQRQVAVSLWCVLSDT